MNRRQRFARCVVSWCLLGMVVCLLLSGVRKLLPQEKGSAAAGWAIKQNGFNAYGEVPTTGIKRLDGYYRYDSTRCFVIDTGKDEDPKAITKRVWFETRKQAQLWARREKYTIHWTVLTPQVERRMKLDKLPSVKGR